MDQWITSCGSQSIGLLLSKHAAESVGREIWAAGVEVHAFLRIDKHIDRTLIEQQLYQLFFVESFTIITTCLGFFFLYKWLNFTAFFLFLFLMNPILCRKWSLLGCKSDFFSFPSKLDSDVYDEDGNSLPSMDYDREQMDVRSPSSIADDLYSLYYPEKRWLDSQFFFSWESLLSNTLHHRVVLFMSTLFYVSVYCQNVYIFDWNYYDFDFVFVFRLKCRSIK